MCILPLAVLSLAAATLAPEPASATNAVSLADILAGRHDQRRVSVRATVFDALYDDVDDSVTFLILRQGDDFVYAHMNKRPPAETLRRLVGAEVSVHGSVKRAEPRGYLRRALAIDRTDAITVIQPATHKTSRPPDLTDEPAPDLIGGSGWMQRRRTEGRVLAVWGEKSILVRTDDGRLARIELAHGSLPACGERIEAVGFPETDLISLNLMRATWNSLPGREAKPAKVQRVKGPHLFIRESGVRRLCTYLYGELIRTRGEVRAVSAPDGAERVIRLDCDGFELTVDVGNHSEMLSAVSVGATVEVCGIVVLDTLPWRPQTPFPHIQGLRLVLRTPADLEVVAPAPWWTPERLLMLVGVLAAVLVGILIWNALLQRLIERRGRALLRAEVESIKSELKTEERTRISIELHDTLAQNLTGVSMELEAAKRSDPDGATRHLTIADCALKSCRSELRNALWDLRNQALEERDLVAAIRKTLVPHVKGVTLDVSFPVPRHNLSDPFTHQILSVIRELVLNAIRHGGATEIRITGALRDGRLVFSVEDNGCGFDPDDCPGVTEGHFGLQGIRERLRALSGKLTFVRRPGGMTATVEAVA